MNMPEGWKRVNQSISEYKTITDTTRMLDLLKDMAEALEALTRSGFRPDQKQEATDALGVLNRFKEWK